VEEPACKPDSVRVDRGGDHLSGSHVTAALVQPTRERWAGRPPAVAGLAPCLALLRVGFAEPRRSLGALVSSYLTVSPLPLTGRSLLCGTFRGLPRLGVTQHPALRSPDFPRPRSPRPRPPGQLLRQEYRRDFRGSSLSSHLGSARGIGAGHVDDRETGELRSEPRTTSTRTCSTLREPSRSGPGSAGRAALLRPPSSQY
jgi:hypothetical protein